MRMSIGVIFVVIIAAAFVTMMHVKNGVQDLKAEKHAGLLKRESFQETIRVLYAEKAYLARPEQLQAFASALRLQPIQPQQVVLLPHGVQASFGQAN